MAKRVESLLCFSMSARPDKQLPREFVFRERYQANAHEQSRPGKFAVRAINVPIRCMGAETNLERGELAYCPWISRVLQHKGERLHEQRYRWDGPDLKHTVVVPPGIGHPTRYVLICRPPRRGYPITKFDR